jgi:hypothetical protein
MPLNGFVDVENLQPILVVLAQIAFGLSGRCLLIKVAAGSFAYWG